MSFSDFRRKHAAFTAAIAVIIVGMLAIDGWVLYKRAAYENEVARLRAGMSEFERRRSDAVTNTNEKRTAMMLELLRRQAKIDKEIHLAVAVDSSRMYLERDGALLREMGVEYTLLDSGCCGMAGSFGFEPHKYEVSVAAAERVLMPAVRGADEETLVIANGFSCQEQVEQLGGKRPLHLAEVIAMTIETRVSS
jgi:hypothetical protein